MNLEELKARSVCTVSRRNADGEFVPHRVFLRQPRRPRGAPLYPAVIDVEVETVVEAETPWPAPVEVDPQVRFLLENGLASHIQLLIDRFGFTREQAIEYLRGFAAGFRSRVEPKDTPAGPLGEKTFRSGSVSPDLWAGLLPVRFTTDNGPDLDPDAGLKPLPPFSNELRTFDPDELAVQQFTRFTELPRAAVDPDRSMSGVAMLAAHERYLPAAIKPPAKPFASIGDGTLEPAWDEADQRRWEGL